METKTLILDESKWRCGIQSGWEINKRGKGPTRLLNGLGFQCCLGLFIPQLIDASSMNLIDMSIPSDLGVEIPLLTETIDGYNRNSEFSIKAIDINDNEFTTVDTKVRYLKFLLKEFGYELIFQKMKKT